jgi:hypothetical protein
MAPEQARGDTDNVGAAADQFALAAIIYEMLTRRAAFAGNCLETVLYRIAHVEPESMIELVAEVPVAVDRVVRRALSKDVPARFPSIASFFNALRDAAEAPELLAHDSKSAAMAPQLSATTKDLNGEAVAASRQRPLSKGRRPAWIGLALGAGVVLFLLAGIQHRGTMTPRPPEPAPIQIPRVVSAPPSPRSEWPPTADSHVTAAPPALVSSEAKPKGRGQGTRGQTRRVREPIPNRTGDDTAPQPISSISPSPTRPVPLPKIPPPVTPPTEAMPEPRAPRPRVSGFTKL